MESVSSTAGFTCTVSMAPKRGRLPCAINGLSANAEACRAKVRRRLPLLATVRSRGVVVNALDATSDEQRRLLDSMRILRTPEC